MRFTNAALAVTENNGHMTHKQLVRQWMHDMSQERGKIGQAFYVPLVPQQCNVGFDSNPREILAREREALVETARKQHAAITPTATIIYFACQTTTQQIPTNILPWLINLQKSRLLNSRRPSPYSTRTVMVSNGVSADGVVDSQEQPEWPIIKGRAWFDSEQHRTGPRNKSVHQSVGLSPLFLG